MERYFNVAKPRPARTGTALETFERQVLFFPLVVVVLACASFLFGGRCAAWQWWTAIAAVVATPFVQKTTNRSWTDAPFGYWVVVSPKTAHYAEYYRRTESSDSGRGENKPRFPVKDILHAWFVTLPREVWRNFFSWR